MDSITVGILIIFGKKLNVSSLINLGLISGILPRWIILVEPYMIMHCFYIFVKTIINNKSKPRHFFL